jgi:hypothetical protein
MPTRFNLIGDSLRVASRANFGIRIRRAVEVRTLPA